MVDMTTLLHHTPPDTIDAGIEDDIAHHGFATHHVTGDASRPSWSHTVGLDGLGYPELVVVGVTAEAGGALLHWIVDLLRGGERLTAGRDRHLAFRGVPIRLVPVPEQCWDDDNDLLRAGRAHRRGTGRARSQALQVVWADGAGRFPWEATFDAELAWLQPLLEHAWTRWQRA